jgi:hypothetical protein
MTLHSDFEAPHRLDLVCGVAKKRRIRYNIPAGQVVPKPKSNPPLPYLYLSTPANILQILWRAFRNECLCGFCRVGARSECHPSTS